MLPDLNRLRVFHHVYAAGSIVAASETLHVTQSAVSQSLSKLEEEIGTPLFTRMHKKMTPTRAGKRLFDIVDPCMSSLRAGIRTIHQSRKQPMGPLKIGAPAEFGKTYFPGIFASFRRKYPKVDFFLELGNPERLLQQVEVGRLDFAFVDVFPKSGGDLADLTPFRLEPVIEEEVILTGSREYCDENLRSDSGFEHIQRQVFIAYQGHDMALINWFRHHFGKSPGRLNIALTIDSLQATIGAIRHHMGLGVIATHHAWEEIRLGEFVVVETGKPHIMNSISLALLKRKQPSLTEATFLDHFHREIRRSGIHRRFSKMAAVG